MKLNTKTLSSLALATIMAIGICIPAYAADTATDVNAEISTSSETYEHISLEEYYDLVRENDAETENILSEISARATMEKHVTQYSKPSKKYPPNTMQYDVENKGVRWQGTLYLQRVMTTGESKMWVGVYSGTVYARS